jgi:hypothetical protein
MPLKIMLSRSPSVASSGIGTASFATRNAFARQRRFRRVQGRGLDHARVGRDFVAFLDQDDVARNDVGGIDTSLLTVSNHTCVRCRHLTQRGHSRLGSRLLEVAHHGVEQHDRADGDGLLRQRESRS